jgi:hypothetical protein
LPFNEVGGKDWWIHRYGTTVAVPVPLRMSSSLT